MLSKLLSHDSRNPVAYLALFVAMGATAVAAKPLLTVADIQDDSLTGADVVVTSLGKVPNADTLDGLDSTGFVQGTGKVQRFYTSETAESSDINHDFDGGIAHLSLTCLEADGAPPTA